MTGETGRLAPYAASEAQSRGRRYPEPAAPFRNDFQRDRDRILHSSAFRRLLYKTQVFVNYEGDMYRTRLTHSLEVAQIARTVARALSLNEDLVEAISLAHDLGHTPFGHAGQDALNACMRDYGGFEHNLQSLRVVDLLEARYAAFPGLNLTFETREGILKHCSAKNARELGDVGRRFLERRQPGLEAQLANLADAIAYNHHDVDDGIRAGLLSVEQLTAEPLFADCHAAVINDCPGIDADRVVPETIRRMINTVVTELIEATRARLDAAAPASIDAVRTHGSTLVGFGEETAGQHLSLKRFLMDNMYKHDRVREMTQRAKRTVADLFDRYMNDVSELPEDFAQAAARSDADGRARVVADYIAGMTDRFAFREHERLAG
ncbi:MAG: deoxyguanosinetriphosphate triphosphohydrolase [Woeseiaceae bacterium]|nr:deoxyguanosinetriphosphate triphosphohydrolase [Woeseiaceae bacterium]